MKCRDPKTGEVFEDIEKAHSWFCSSSGARGCQECHLYIDRTGHGCVNYRNTHPAEAARLMGLEVVEEPAMGETQGRKPHFTKEEVAQAEDIRRIFGREDVIKRTDEGALRYGYIFLNSALFPSLRPGQAVSLKKVIGGPIS